VKSWLLTGIFLAALIPVKSEAQSQSSAASTDRPQFDAVSIKANKNQGVGRINLAQSGGHLTASNVSVKFLIIQAYTLGRVNFGANPARAEWIDSEHFDIEAEAEGNPTIEQKRLMVQSLLASRFKLVMHHETRQMPVLALLPVKSGKTGPRLPPHSDATKCLPTPVGQGNPAVAPGETWVPPCGGLRVVSDDLAGQNVSMDQLAQTLSILVDRNVVDRTGLEGTFDVTLQFQRAALDASTLDQNAPPPIATALREQLGLKLESQKAPLDVLVIDHVEEPSAN
jgi:uncharacterized protein (TIGR03435 family)